MDHMLQGRNIIGVQHAVNTRIFAQNEMAAAFRLSKGWRDMPRSAPGHRLSPAATPARATAPARQRALSVIAIHALVQRVPRRERGFGRRTSTRIGARHARACCRSLPQALRLPARGAGRYSPSLSAQCCDDAPQIALLPRRQFGVIMPNPLTIPIEQTRAAALANPLPAVGGLAAGTITVLATDLHRLCGRSCAGAPVARL